MRYRWSRAAAGHPRSWVHDAFEFHDLLDQDGSQVAWVRVRVDRVPHEFEAHYKWEKTMHPTLKEAKAHIIAQLVAQRLEDSA